MVNHTDILMTDIYEINVKSEQMDLIDQLIEGSSDCYKRDAKVRLRRILDLLPKPYSVSIEYGYIDKVYRDSYYTLFSSKHFEMQRNSIRLSFFQGNDIEYLYFFNEDGHRKLNDTFIGFTVLKPIFPGSIGRTYLNPYKLSHTRGISVRTTRFNVVVLGCKLEIDAFPFSSQDSETMTCAETSVWNIMEYFGNRYSDYKTVLPSDIFKAVAEYSNERVIPSRGLRIDLVSRLLMEFGFSPRIYAQNARTFHHYVESGIPLLVSTKSHAFVCIGHGNPDTDNVSAETIGSLKIINSADFYKKYVIMDDNYEPYLITDLYHIPGHDNKLTVEAFVVPLYKRIYLEAGDAYLTVESILLSDTHGIKKILDYLNELDDEEKNGITQYGDDNPLIIRFFLTSSRQYRIFHATNQGDTPQGFAIAGLYSTLPLPKFIWVAELSLKDMYLEDRIFGEIIIDATATKKSTLDSVIAIHYPGIVAYRKPNQSIEELLGMFSSYSTPFAYPLYKNNLNTGGESNEKKRS